ncbi:MAG: TolC family protein [Pirellulaceae bacterium]
MSHVKWFVWAAVIGLLPDASIAQTSRSGVTLSDVRSSRAVPELLTAPLPAVIPGESAASLAQEQLPPTTGMTLADLEQMALGRNPTLAQAAAQVAAAQGRHVQAGLYPNPVAGYMGSEMGNSGRAGQQGGFVSQEVVTAGKRQLSRNVVSQEIRQLEFAWEAQRQRVLTDVRSSFYDVLVAQRAVELTGELVRIGDAGVKSAEALMREKEVGRNDVLQARIESDSAKVFLERAHNRYVGAWRNLAAVVGDSALEPRPLVGDVQDGLSPLTWEDTFHRLLSQSPELAQAEAGVARAQAALRRECAGRYPNVDLQAAVQYDDSTNDTFGSVQVGVPILIYNRNQGNIRRAQAELMAAQNDVQRIQLALQQRLGRAFEQYANAIYQVEKYKQNILPAAEASLTLTNEGYRQGEFSFLSLLTAQRTFFQTNLAYLESLRDLRASATAIEGNLLGDSLQVGGPADRGSSPDYGSGDFGIFSDLFERR